MWLGTAVTVMIACVSPEEASLSETLCTLQYASSAAMIVNTPKIHLGEPKSAQVTVMQEEIAQLQLELSRVKAEAKLALGGQGAGDHSSLSFRDHAIGSGGGSGGSGSIPPHNHHQVTTTASNRDPSASFSQMYLPGDVVSEFKDLKSAHAATEKRLRDTEVDLEEAQAVARELAGHVFTLLSDVDMRIMQADRAAARLAAVASDLAPSIAPSIEKIHRVVDTINKVSSFIIELDGSHTRDFLQKKKKNKKK
jgi:hypothetical protein